MTRRRCDRAAAGSEALSRYSDAAFQDGSAPGAGSRQVGDLFQGRRDAARQALGESVGLSVARGQVIHLRQAFGRHGGNRLWDLVSPVSPEDLRNKAKLDAIDLHGCVYAGPKRRKQRRETPSPLLCYVPLKKARNQVSRNT
jgi:hypothetical protein